MRVNVKCLRFFLAFLAVTPILCCSRGGPVVDAGDTTVSPERRLADYLDQSRFPETSRPARPDTPELDGLVATEKSAASSAEIVGWDGEELRAGSLVVFLRVRVRDAGRYSFRSILSDADGVKLAVATETKDLAIGNHRIALLFYGLIFHETRWKTPFILQGAAAERLPTDAELANAVKPDGSVNPPPEGRLTTLRKTYSTKNYKLNDFSKAVWDSPEKQARIRALKEEIDTKKSK